MPRVEAKSCATKAQVGSWGKGCAERNAGGRRSRSPLVIIRSDDKTSEIILDCKLSRAH